jgi:hypothetical protein
MSRLPAFILFVLGLFAVQLTLSYSCFPYGGWTEQADADNSIGKAPRKPHQAPTEQA